MSVAGGLYARVQRAERQIDDLKASIADSFSKHPYTIFVAERSGIRTHSLRVTGGVESEVIDWGVLVGEIAHNLRAALDNLAWHVAQMNAPYPYERTAFPIFLRGRTKRRRSTGKAYLPSFWGQQRGDGTDITRSMHADHRERMESFQPYKRGNGGRANALYRLHG